jgi:hypothetical protein
MMLVELDGEMMEILEISTTETTIITTKTVVVMEAIRAQEAVGEVIRIAVSLWEEDMTKVTIEVTLTVIPTIIGVVTMTTKELAGDHLNLQQLMKIRALVVAILLNILESEEAEVVLIVPTLHKTKEAINFKRAKASSIKLSQLTKNLLTLVSSAI